MAKYTLYLVMFTVRVLLTVIIALGSKVFAHDSPIAEYYSRDLFINKTRQILLSFVHLHFLSIYPTNGDHGGSEGSNAIFLNQFLLA